MSYRSRLKFVSMGRCIGCGSPDRPLATKRYCRVCQDKRNAYWMRGKHASYERVKSWREANPEQRLVQASRSAAVRNARKRSQGGSMSTLEWAQIKAAQDERCFDCGVETKLTVGHVLPISRGGSSYPRNIVAQCLPCNRAQGSTIHWSFMTANCAGERPWRTEAA